jgi:hypothetical protein
VPVKRRGARGFCEEYSGLRKRGANHPRGRRASGSTRGLATKLIMVII